MHCINNHHSHIWVQQTMILVMKYKQSQGMRRGLENHFSCVGSHDENYGLFSDVNMRIVKPERGW